MSNHGTDSENLNLGATGKFPLGKLTPLDEGELRFAIGEKNGKVIFNFGKEVSWFGMTPDQAISLADILKTKAYNMMMK